MSIKEIEAFVSSMKKYDEFRIIYHVRPDGDCIGSSYALAMALQSVGKKCEVRGDYPVPKIHRHMTDVFKADILSEPVYLAVDASSPERLGSFQNVHYTFCLDHHQDNSIAAEYKYVEPDCGACAEIILKVIKALGADVTKAIADLLYTALVTDTMCFRTVDTSRQTFETAAELAGYGADICEIGRRNMFIKSPQRMKIEDILRKSFHYTCENRILTGIITLENLEEADIQDSELEGINSIVDQVEGVDIGVTIRELPDKSLVRCSMRTKGIFSAHEICKQLGGGGHSNAAACYLPNVDVYEARAIIEEVCSHYLKEKS